MDLQLKNKTALVTGASVGIGRGIAKALAAEGVKLAISARRADKLQEVADEIVAAGGHRPVIIESDLYPEDAAAKLTAAAIQGLGHVDILVNNAGGSRSFKDLHVSEEAWQEAITQIGESDAWFDGVSIEGGRVKRERPMRFGRRQAFGMAIVQDSVVKMTGHTGLVVGVQGGHEGVHIQTQFLRQLWQRLSDGAFKHGRHKTAHGFGI